MAEKPTYEELAQRVRELEQEKHEINLKKDTTIQGEKRGSQEKESKIKLEHQILDADLAAIIDTEKIQSFMEDFCRLTNMVTAILDIEGKVIEATGWQDICTKFHRINPKTALNCTESDLFLAKNLKPGEYVEYKCKNGLWDVVTPLYVGNKHLGNIYTGQFFYDDEKIDTAFFIKQAETFGFDRNAYLEALQRVPRYSRETVANLMSFLVKFTTYISGIGLLNLQLKKEVRERRLAEEALTESESFIKSVIDNLPIGVAVNSVDPDVTFEYMNDNFCRYYRTTREALSDPDAFWTSVYEDPDFREEIKKRVLDDCNSGDPARMYWADIPITRKGEEASFVTARNISIPEKHVMISTVWDVTEQKRIEARVKENERLLNEVGRIAKIGGWEFDPQSLRGTWTDEVARIHDMAPQDETGLQIGLNFYHGEHRKTIERAVTEAVELAKPYDLELEIVTAKGNRKWIRTIGEPVKKGDTVVKVRGSVQDVTHRKKTEEKIHELNRNLELRVHQRTAQLKEANKELEDFVYSVSHDLRAPLRSISGFAEIINRRHKASLNEEGQHYFDNIVKAGKQMGELIDDLLKFSRLGRQAIKSENLSLFDVFRTAMETLSDPIKKTSAKVNFPERMPAIQGDSTLTNHVFINLLENAVKYHKPGKPPLIDVGVEVKDQYVVVSITDNGIGIAPEYQEKIFNIFQRLHSQADYPGTGIGLAAVRKALQVMGGEVWVESEPDKGSVFKVKVLTAIPSTSERTPQ